jgi:hypothetical protein
MKFIKKFESHKATSKEVIPIETLFTDDEFEGIKDLYRDLVEDIDLTDVSDSGVDQRLAMTSNLSYFSKINWTDGSDSDKFRIDISIRTANLDTYPSNTKEDIEKYNFISRDVQPFIDTLKSMGYLVHKRDLDRSRMKISITK